MRKIINDGVEASTRKSQARFQSICLMLGFMRLNNRKTCLKFPCLGLSTIIDSINLTYRLLNVSLKRKTENRSVCPQKRERARAAGVLQQGAGIRQISLLSQEGLQISVSCRHMLLFMTNTTEFVFFSSPGIFDAGIKRCGKF